jgi:hypothetical protein
MAKGIYGPQSGRARIRVVLLFVAVRTRQRIWIAAERIGCQLEKNEGLAQVLREAF